MARRAGIGYVVLFALFGAGRAEPQNREDLDALRLAVFRHQVSFWLAEHSRESGTVVCLAIEQDGVRRRVDEEYLRQFPGEAAVRTADQCEQRPSGAVERRTGRPAILLTVGEIVWKSSDEAWVTTRHFGTAVISGVRTQRAVREKGEWTCLGQIIRNGPL